MATWDYSNPQFDTPGNPVPDEWVWGRLRLRRNAELTASDWTQTADAPVDKAAWAAYRQALRDLPANTSDPREAVWPTPPAV